ncbi:MAG: hypothetical protein KC457_34170, partial [Myxococcales bacterium]|nr:hypothetical protein [Myxococcales bacterium]
MSAAVDPRRVQHALVCMLFDPKLAARICGTSELAADDPPLSADERTLLRAVDPRALATDHMRRARALQVILEEYPVSAAVVGVDWVDGFFASAVFRRCVSGRGAMAPAFAAYLGNRAKGVGIIEAALA